MRLRFEIYTDLRDRTKQHESFSIEHTIATSENKILEMEIEFNYLEFEDEEYYCAIARDITERKRTEAKLLESEARFRNLADTAPVMIWMTDSSKLCNYCNKPWLEFTGRTLEEELGYGWTEFIHLDDKAICMENFSSEFDNKREFNNEYRLKRYDGQYRWILNTGIPRFTTDGSF